MLLLRVKKGSKNRERGKAHSVFNEVREKYDLIFRSTMLEYSEDDVQAQLDIK